MPLKPSATASTAIAEPSVSPLGVYIHIPFCDAKCPYCAFYSRPSDAGDDIDAYLTALEHECRRRYALLPYRHRRATTVYCGGGTPSLLSLPQLERLCEMVRTVFAPPALAEWTVECNPGSLTPVKLVIMTRAGVNRISLGAQSMDNAVLRYLGRRHDVAAVVQAAAWIAESGVRNWNLDLIACVPGVGDRRWRTLLRRATALRPAHVSVYALTLDEGFGLAVMPGRRTPSVPDDARQLRLLRITREQLQADGFKRYEISNYARRGRQCRHHLDFWRGGDYLGFGPSAVSRWGLSRRRNRPDLAAYLAAFGRGADVPHESEVVSALQGAAERLVYGLRLSEGVKVGALCAELNLPGGPTDWPQPTWRMLARHGLVRRQRGRMLLTPRGFEVADAIALELWPSCVDGSRPAVASGLSDVRCVGS